MTQPLPDSGSAPAEDAAAVAGAQARESSAAARRAAGQRGTTKRHPATVARRMLQRMREGEWFRLDEPTVTSRHLAAHDVTSVYNATNARQKQLRRRLLEDLFAQVGDEVELRAPIYVEHGSQVSIGEGTVADHSLTLSDHAPITLGRRVRLGAGVTLLTTDVPVEAVPRSANWAKAQPISIGDEVAIGAHAVVMPGVSIGARTVVGAGAVVTRDLPADVVAVGNPARILRQITDHGTEPEA